MGPEIVKRLLYVLAYFFFFSTTIAAVAQDEPKNPLIESIEVIAGNDKPEQVVFKLNGSYTPRIFKLNGGNPRLVLDFYGVKYPARIDRISDVGGDIIAGVRVGRHNDPQKIRVVVDIQQDSPYQYDQTFNVSNNSLVVTFDPDYEATAGEEQATSQPQRISAEATKVVHAQTETSGQPESASTVTSEQETSAESQDQKIEAAPAIAAEPREEAQTTTLPVIEEPVEPDPAAQQPDQTVEPDPAAQQPDQTVETDPAAQQPDQTVETDPAAQQPDQTVETDPAAQQPSQTEEIEPILLDISFEKSVNKSETVMFRLNHFYPPLVFGIEKGEPRVVCDFIDAGIGEDIPPVIEAGGQYVNRILVSKESDPDKVRVELLLMPNRNYDLQQLFFKEDNLFVVIVKELQ